MIADSVGRSDIPFFLIFSINQLSCCCVLSRLARSRRIPALPLVVFRLPTGRPTGLLTGGSLSFRGQPFWRTQHASQSPASQAASFRPSAASRRPRAAQQCLECSRRGSRPPTGSQHPRQSACERSRTDTAGDTGQVTPRGQSAGGFRTAGERAGSDLPRRPSGGTATGTAAGYVDGGVATPLLQPVEHGPHPRWGAPRGLAIADCGRSVRLQSSSGGVDQSSSGNRRRRAMDGPHQRGDHRASAGPAGRRLLPQRPPVRQLSGLAGNLRSIRGHGRRWWGRPGAAAGRGTQGRSATGLG